MTSLTALFEPSSIAVVGASENVRKIRGRLLQLMKTGGYEGRLYPVNPSSAVIQGLPAYPSIEALPEVVDLALVAVPADQVMPVLEACAARGVRAAAIFSAGSGAAPVGSRLQDQVADFCQRTGMRVLGPNAEGFIDTVKGLIATFSPTMNAAPPVSPSGPRQGHVSIVSQSGAVAFALYGRACVAQLPVRYLVSTGNEADIECAEVIEHLIEEGSSRAILLFLEGFKDPRRFLEVARKAQRANIPILVAKVGRSQAGQRATVSHTAHLAGSDQAYDAVFARHGILRVDDAEEMIALAAAFSLGAVPTGKRVAIITTSGGAGGWAADQCETGGLDVPLLPEPIKERLRALIPDYGSTENPVDVTASVVEDGGEKLAPIVHEIAQLDGIDVVLVIVSMISGERLQQIDQLLPSIIQSSPVPIYFHSPGATHASTAGVMARAGSAVFSLPLFAKLVRKLAEHHAARPAVAAALAETPAPAPAYRPGMVHQPETLMAAYGIPRPAEAVATSAREAAQAAERIGYPVAVKVLSDLVPHKTEAGALALSLASPEAVEAAYERVIENSRRHAGDDGIDTVLVQKMMPPGRELMIGGLMDPDFGPMVMLGFGGVYVEVLKDTTLAMAPLSLDEAHRMIDALQGSSLLRGVRGEAPSDIAALAEVLVAASRLIKDAGDELQEMDLNPVIVYPQGHGAVVVDHLFVPRRHTDAVASH